MQRAQGLLERVSKIFAQIVSGAGQARLRLPGQIFKYRELGQKNEALAALERIGDPARVVGRPVEVCAYAEEVVIRQDGQVVAQHDRRFGRGQTVYDPWHYVPVLSRKPGALRNGAPFKDWALPGALAQIQRRLKRATDGDRQMVDILNAVLIDGLPAVEAACAEALAGGVSSSDVVLNLLARRNMPAPVANVLTPQALTLSQAPLADCARYDDLRRCHGTR